MEWLTGIDPETIAAVQFGTREWLYVKSGTFTVSVPAAGEKTIVEFDDEFSEHWVRGLLDAVTAVRYKKPEPVDS